MKKKSSRSQSKKAPAELLAALTEQRKLVTQQEAAGNFDTYDHSKLARLETAVNEYTEVE